MDLAYILKELWRQRVWVAVVAALAVVIALGSAYRLSFLPPSLNEKVLDVGAARAQILVDSPQSSLPNLDSDITRLTIRAGVFAAYALTTPARLEVAERTGMSLGAIAFDTGSGNDANVANTGAINSESRANKLVDESSAYRVRINSSGNLPVISVQTQAPTGREAVRLADATVGGLIAAIKKLERGQQIPIQSRATLTPLGQSSGGDVSTQTNVRTAVLTFFVAFALLLVLILVISNVRASWGASQSRDEPLEPLDDLSGTLTLSVDERWSDHSDDDRLSERRSKGHEGTALHR